MCADIRVCVKELKVIRCLIHSLTVLPGQFLLFNQVRCPCEGTDEEPVNPKLRNCQETGKSFTGTFIKVYLRRTELQ